MEGPQLLSRSWGPRGFCRLPDASLGHPNSQRCLVAFAVTREAVEGRVPSCTCLAGRKTCSGLPLVQAPSAAPPRGLWWEELQDIRAPGTPETNPPPVTESTHWSCRGVGVAGWTLWQDSPEGESPLQRMSCTRGPPSEEVVGVVLSPHCEPDLVIPEPLFPQSTGQST